MKFKSAYSASKSSALKCVGETRTKQSFKAECDINNLLKKYQKTGMIDHVNKYKGQYGDLSNPVDYQTALNVIIAAQASFDSLPSSVRKRFGNDPGEFVQFVSDPKNKEALYDLGLATRPAPADPHLPDVGGSDPDPNTPDPNVKTA
jgi:phage internal scaffolding protein